MRKIYLLILFLLSAILISSCQGSYEIVQLTQEDILELESLLSTINKDSSILRSFSFSEKTSFSYNNKNYKLSQVNASATNKLVEFTNPIDSIFESDYTKYAITDSMYYQVTAFDDLPRTIVVINDQVRISQLYWEKLEYINDSYQITSNEFNISYYLGSKVIDDLDFVYEQDNLVVKKIEYKNKINYIYSYSNISPESSKALYLLGRMLSDVLIPSFQFQMAGIDFFYLDKVSAEVIVELNKSKTAINKATLKFTNKFDNGKVVVFTKEAIMYHSAKEISVSIPKAYKDKINEYNKN